MSSVATRFISMAMLVLAPGVALTVATTEPSQAWNHNPASARGPERWGLIDQVYGSFATCGTSSVQVGKQQTPIDIRTAAAIPAPLGHLEFDYEATPFHVINTLHVVEIEYEAGSRMRIGPGVTDEYHLRQFHFHATSEHRIDGVLADAELHLVHQNYLGDLAVVAVLLDKEGIRANPLYDAIMFGSPIGVSDVTEAHLGGSINARDLLPDTRRFYTYSGSLTTPPCTEGVRWFVMADRQAISAAALARYHYIISRFPGYDGFQNNNRPVSATNGRNVLLAAEGWR